MGDEGEHDGLVEGGLGTVAVVTRQRFTMNRTDSLNQKNAYGSLWALWRMRSTRKV